MGKRVEMRSSQDYTPVGQATDESDDYNRRDSLRSKGLKSHIGLLSSGILHQTVSFDAYR